MSLCHQTTEYRARNQSRKVLVLDLAVRREAEEGATLEVRLECNTVSLAHHLTSPAGDPHHGYIPVAEVLWAGGMGDDEEARAGGENVWDQILRRSSVARVGKRVKASGSVFAVAVCSIFGEDDTFG